MFDNDALYTINRLIQVSLAIWKIFERKRVNKNKFKVILLEMINGGGGGGGGGVKRLNHYAKHHQDKQSQSLKHSCR